MLFEEVVEELAKILHLSGREAVTKRMVVRNDLPVLPFIEWPDLTEFAREGRRMMARYLLHPDNRAVVLSLIDETF